MIIYNIRFVHYWNIVAPLLYRCYYAVSSPYKTPANCKCLPALRVSDRYSPFELNSSCKLDSGANYTWLRFLYSVFIRLRAWFSRHMMPGLYFASCIVQTAVYEANFKEKFCLSLGSTWSYSSIKSAEVSCDVLLTNTNVIDVLDVEVRMLDK